MFIQIIRLIRPWHWIKNGVVLAGLIFSGTALVRENQIMALIAMLAFCLISSSVYALNDISDRKRDKEHPLKKNRPLVSGTISIMTAGITSIGFLLAGFALSLLVNTEFVIFALAYLLLNLLYNLVLKNVVILDVMSIAAGFVLRAVAGTVAIGVEFSDWLLVSTFVLALFLALGKRRYELIVLGSGGVTHREILQKYSRNLLDQLIAVVTASTVVTYFFYTLSPAVQSKLHTEYMVLTTPFVIYGVFRYLYLVHKESKGGFPTRLLLTDRPLLLNVLLWLASVLLILYI